MLNGLRHWGQAVADVLYPPYCPSCQAELLPGEDGLCLGCVAALPATGHGLTPHENSLTRQLREAGLAPAQGVAGWFFTDGGMLQHALHALKYGNQPQVGRQLGLLLGKYLEGLLPEEAVLVPVPLHPRRYIQRGYNQAEWIAWGLGQALGAPVRTDLLIRARHTRTQTRLDRSRRAANLQGAFRAAPEVPPHLLLVDDLVTTGATLAQAGQALAASGCQWLGVAAVGQAVAG